MINNSRLYGGWKNHTLQKYVGDAAADLGMFSMFGRTGAPQEGQQIISNIAICWG